VEALELQGEVKEAKEDSLIRKITTFPINLDSCPLILKNLHHWVAPR
jgi:hypothetical protein